MTADIVIQEENILSVWIPGDKNSTDLMTENLPRPFEKYTKVYYGDGEYYKKASEALIKGECRKVIRDRMITLLVGHRGIEGYIG
jgi:hypothetical protein